MSNPMLEMTDVVKSYGHGATEVRAVTGISITVGQGEFVALRGPSGSGKSTLLHLAGGLEDPTAGQVAINGRAIYAMTPTERAQLRRGVVGFVFQRLNLVPALTAWENVMLPLELDGNSTRQAKADAREALHAVALDHHLDRYPDDFSGGEQQRIAIARAIVGTRRLLLADEPTGSLDTRTGDAVMELIASLPERAGTAIILVTHEPRYAAWADRVVSMRDGHIVDTALAPTPEASVGAGL